MQLLPEPDAHPAAEAFKAALKGDGIPCASFAVRDVHAERARPSAAGVQFTRPPTEAGPVTAAVHRWLAIAAYRVATEECNSGSNSLCYVVS